MTNLVICTVVLVMANGYHNVYRLQGHEFPEQSMTDRIFVDFERDWPVEINKNQPTTFYVDENSCAYYDVNTK